MIEKNQWKVRIGGVELKEQSPRKDCTVEAESVALPVKQTKDKVCVMILRGLSSFSVQREGSSSLSTDWEGLRVLGQM